jgi:hypothetical protein
MERITKIRVKRPNGSFTDPVPIGARSEDITMTDGSSLQEILGNINFSSEGSVKEQIQAILAQIGDGDYS